MASLARRSAGIARARRSFEQTLAVVRPPTISAEDIGSYVNANLARLERFVDRELHFRRADNEIPFSRMKMV